MYKLSPTERETIILFNEGEATAEIEVHNAAMRRRLEAVRREYPEDIRLVKRDKYADCYIFPKKWIKIAPPRRLSEAQQKQLEQARRSKGGNTA